MTDFHASIPGFSIKPYTHLVPSLERSRVTTSDLLTLDATEISKRARLPIIEVRKLATAILVALRSDLGLRRNVSHISGQPYATRKTAGGAHLREKGSEIVKRWTTISTLDDSVDRVLNSGVPIGYVTEVTGEAGTGKTLFLLTLLLASQLPPPLGLGKAALYVTTEHALPVTRLKQMLRGHPRLLGLETPPNLDKILSIAVPDLESQDHILRFQVPVAIKRHDVGLVVVDSVTANYRAEMETQGGPSALARRAGEMVRLGRLLREIARDQNVAVAVSNQVADRFGPVTGPPRPTPSTASSTGSQQLTPTPTTGRGRPVIPIRGASSMPPPPIPAKNRSQSRARRGKVRLRNPTPRPMSLDHQQLWFTGWGTRGETLNLKNPALGPTWAHQLDARIVLTKNLRYSMSSGTTSSEWKREMKLVFAPWATGDDGNIVPFEITQGGLIAKETKKEGNDAVMKGEGEGK